MLKGFNNTRWNSTLHYLRTIESFLLLSSQTNSVTKQMGKCDQCVADVDNDVLQQLSSFMKPFEEMTELVNVVGPSMSFIHLFKQKIKKMCKIMDHEDANIKGLKQWVLDNLDKRMRESEACKVAIFFYLSIRGLTINENATDSIRCEYIKLRSKGIMVELPEQQTNDASNGGNLSADVATSSSCKLAVSLADDDEIQTKKIKLLKGCRALFQEI